MSSDLIRKAADIVGGVKELAEALGVPKATVYSWRDGVRNFPAAKLGARLEAATGGKVSRKHLCPKDWRQIWPELA